MDKIIYRTLLLVILVIFVSGAVAVYTIFFSTAEDVTMPLLRGKSVLEATSEVERLGFKARVEQAVSSLPPGRVLAQSPEVGTRVRKNQTVVLQVSRGAARRGVPDVRGLSVSQAQSAIQEQGFSLGDVIYIKDDSRQVGTVIAQSPAAPASVPGDREIDLLVNQAGAAGRVAVPDVAQMTERQARELLAASGLRVMVVESVYSPNAAEGSVINTRPAAGTTVKSGDGVRLRLATATRPAGVPEPPRPAENAPASSGQVVVTVPGHGDVVIGNGTQTSPTSQTNPTNNVQAVDPNVSVFDQQRPPAVAPAPQAAPVQAPAAPAPAPVTPATVPVPMGGKVARIRYQVPPLARSLQLKIELTDPTGTKVLLDREARSSEYISLDASYSKECAVTIYLGGEFVWQDKYM